MGVRGPDQLPGEWREILGSAAWGMSDGWVLVQNPDPIEEAIVHAHASGRTTAFDPGPLLHRVPDERIARVLAATTVLLLTEEEAGRPVGAGSPGQLTEAPPARGPALVPLKRAVQRAQLI